MMMSDYHVIDEVIHNLDCFIEWFGKVSTEDYFVLYLVISERMILMKIGVISDLVSRLIETLGEGFGLLGVSDFGIKSSKNDLILS